MGYGRRHMGCCMKHLQRIKNRIVYCYVFSVLLLLTSVLQGILLGATELAIETLLQTVLSHNVNTPEWKILCYNKTKLMSKCFIMHFSTLINIKKESLL